jgi:hypothetical protein
MLRALMRPLTALVLALSTSTAFAHESWISRGGHKNPAGEWCCGAEDCGVVSPQAVHAVSGGYSIAGAVTYERAAVGAVSNGTTSYDTVNEVIPYSQALPSPDGAYWRCKRPDGTPRCFFAPPPGT